MIFPYLILENVPQTIQFLQQVFGGVETQRTTSQAGKIKHAEVTIDDAVIMLGEASEKWAARPGTIYLQVNDVDAVYQKALAMNTIALMPPTDCSSGDRYGGVQDEQGNQWWMGTPIEQAGCVKNEEN